MEKSDYFLLLTTKGFMRDYLFGVRAIIDAKKNGVNAMTAKHVSSRRVLKILVSVTSFKNAAKLCGSEYLEELKSCSTEMYDGKLWPELKGNGKDKINLNLLTQKMNDFGIPNDTKIAK